MMFGTGTSMKDIEKSISFLEKFNPGVRQPAPQMDHPPHPYDLYALLRVRGGGGGSTVDRFVWNRMGDAGQADAIEFYRRRVVEWELTAGREEELAREARQAEERRLAQEQAAFARAETARLGDFDDRLGSW
jgi:hypothetical protein